MFPTLNRLGEFPGMTWLADGPIQILASLRAPGAFSKPSADSSDTYSSPDSEPLPAIDAEQLQEPGRNHDAGRQLLK